MSDTADVFVVEIVAYDPVAVGTTTLRYATKGFSSLPTDTPANTHIDGLLRQPLVMRRDLFKAGTTRGRSSVTVGQLELVNDDGALDVILTYGLSGRAITLRRGVPGTAYPSAFTIVFDGTMEQPEATLTSITIAVRDRMMDLLLPLQSTKYAGSNVLPAGLEGTADDLKGKPKPFCLGSVYNVPAPCVNTTKLIHQVNDGAVASVPAVYDRGIQLGAALYLAVGGGTPASTFSSSADGVTFGTSPAILPSSPAVTCSCIGASSLLVLGSAGNVFTSPDGDVWTSHTINAGFQIRGIAYGNSIYVAVGDAGTLYSSPDLITWTSRTSQFTASNIQAVTYANSLFVAVGALGKISTSANGTTWTAQGPAGAGVHYAIAYGAGLYVIVGSGSSCYSSPDGVTWTSRTSAVTGGQQINAVTFGNALFVLGSSAGQVCTSANGTSWTKRASAFPTTDDISAAGYGNGLWFVAGSNALMATSVDGIVWVLVPTGYALGAMTINTVIYGSGLSIADYANATDLEDDTKAPAAGSYKTYLSGGYVRLGSGPAGLVTADVTQGAAAANRTAGQLFTGVLTKAGKSAGASSGNWKAADITTLDGAFTGVCGYWTDEETTFADVLDLIAQTAGAWWGADKAGVYRIKQLLVPSGATVVDLVASDLLQGLSRVAINDDGRGLPSWRTIVRYAKNYAVQDTDLAAGVTDARRAFLKDQWREAKADDAAVQTIHLLAVQTAEDSLLYAAADAATEATRRQTLRGTLRHRYATVIQLNDTTATLDLGDVVSVTHSRFALTGGPSFRILSIEPNGLKRELALEVWK